MLRSPVMLRVARIFVVGADENFAVGDGDIAVALRAELGGPFEILDALGIDFLGAGLEFDLAESRGQTFLGRIHVAHRSRPPHRGQSAAESSKSKHQIARTKNESKCL